MGQHLPKKDVATEDEKHRQGIIRRDNVQVRSVQRVPVNVCQQYF